jgi:hypothetical protein
MTTIDYQHGGDKAKRRAIRAAAKALAYSERNAKRETPERSAERREAFKGTPEMLALASVIGKEKRN